MQTSDIEVYRDGRWWMIRIPELDGLTHRFSDFLVGMSIGHCRCWPKKVNTLCHASAAASLFSPNPTMRDTACRGASSAKLCPVCGYVLTSCGIFSSVNTSSRCFPLPRLRGSRLPKLATMGQAPSTIVAYLRCRGGG